MDVLFNGLANFVEAATEEDKQFVVFPYNLSNYNAVDDLPPVVNDMVTSMAAQIAVLLHKKTVCHDAQCCSMPVAHCAMVWHIAQCQGTKHSTTAQSNAVAQKTALWHIVQLHFWMRLMIGCITFCRLYPRVEEATCTLQF